MFIEEKFITLINKAAEAGEIEPLVFIGFPLAIALISYLIGSIPFGLIYTKMAGLGDVRSIGSGNIGATNVLRTGNKKIAGLTLFSDIAKGYVSIALIVHFILPILGAVLYGPFGVSVALLYAAISGLAAILGHMFPVWLKFKGGKGVATAIGVLLASSVWGGLLVCVLWISVFCFTRISSLSALIAFFIVCLYRWYENLSYIGKFPIYPEGSNVLLFSPAITFTIITLLIFYKHSANIKRLLRGEEPRFSSTK